MPDSIRPIKIFISSPGDVTAERALAAKAVEGLNFKPRLRHHFHLLPLRWDDERVSIPMPANDSAQGAVNRYLIKPSDCDLVVVILWSKMGTAVTIDGEAYLSGTHYEFEDALRGAARNNGIPTVLVYRRDEELLISSKDPERQQKYAQLEQVENFFRGFNNPDGTIKIPYKKYEKPADFEKLLDGDLTAHLLYLLDHPPLVQPTAVPIPIEAPPLWQGSPFPGLKDFTEEQAPIFFGRGRETDALAEKVTANRFVAVVGASGSGKSSLVRAGLIPRLREAGAWHITRIVPGKSPFDALAEALINTIPALRGDPIEFAERAEKLAAILRQKPENLALRGALKNEKSKTNESALIFVDQFEELFTQTPENERAPFAAMLAHDDSLYVVITLRADFYHHAIPYLEKALREGTFTLDKPDAFSLLEMITRPAERAGLAFERGLPEQIVRDTGAEPGALALMAYALDELYHKDKKRLTFDDYRALGGVQGAIGTRAENTFAALSGDDEAKERHMQRVFHELVRVDERGTATRQRKPREGFGDDALVEAFIRARLLTTGEQEGAAVVEVAHEALFRSWERLKRWIAEAQADLILLRQVEEAAVEWDQHGQSNDWRWPAERLQPVYQMQERLQPHLDSMTLDFIEPEQNRLLREIQNIDTPHSRRSEIGERLSRIGDPRDGVGVRALIPDIDWCYVDAPPGAGIEVKGEKFPIQPFYIARYLVTSIQFKAFLEALDGFVDDRWWEGMPDDYRKQEMASARSGFSSYPRDSVSWYQSVAFTRWLDAKYRELGLFDAGTRHASSLQPSHHWQIRLPTEWEWQWAATGGNPANEYPWGVWDGRRANTTEAEINDHSTAVGMYPHGAAACGALDMAGNLWEWCLNEYEDVQRTTVEGNRTKVLRGGSFGLNQLFAACAYRDRLNPHFRFDPYGLRLVCVPY
jgi:energy-coupling factor transporter ATP-binding protein EcfA2